MKLDVHDLTFVPVSALHGDNVVERSANMAWYEGSSLLHHLEEVHIASDRNLIDARFPVQYVIRPQDQVNHDLHDYRGYAGTVAGGVFKPGDEVVVLPSGLTSTDRGPSTPPTARSTRRSRRWPSPIRLADDVDVSRGDMICRARNRPHVGQDLEAMVCWMTSEPSCGPGPSWPSSTPPGGGARWSRTCSTGSTSTPCTATRTPPSLTLNEIGRVRLRTTVPLFFDEYRRNRATGSFVLVDESTNNTVGAGIILGPTEVE